MKQSKMSLPSSQNSLIRPSVGPELDSLVSMELLQGLGEIIAEDTSNIRVQVAILTEYTRSTHAYDASRRFKRHARMGRAAQVSGVARLV